MPIQYSLAHLTVLGCPPPEAARVAARTGYDFVSLRIIMMGASNERDYNYELSSNPSLLRETKAALRETGLKIHDIELAVIRDDLTAKSNLPAMEIAAELGARSVLCSVWTSHKKFAAEQYAELCDLAKPLGMTADLEFVTWANVATLAGAVEVIRTAKRENGGLMLDMLHFHRSRTRVEDLKVLPREWFHFAHLCDAPKEIPATTEGLIHAGREERLYSGEGAIDIAAILNPLPEMVYSVEIPHLARVKEIGYEEHARQALQWTKKYFARHPRESS